jgi:RecA-family ATPase
MEKDEFERTIDDNHPIYEYRILTAKDAMQEHPPVEWVVENLIPSSTLSVFFGDPGSKKTWAMISLAVHVALGKEWLGYIVTPNKVLFIDEESGESWFMRRLKAAILGALGDDTTQVVFICNAGFMLDDKQDIAEVERLIRDSRAGLVIFDALTDIMSGDENTKKDTQPILTSLKKIADRTGAAIILIHHTAKSGGYRGSSAIKGAADLLVEIKSEDDSKWINFRSEKVRHIEFVKFAGVAEWTETQFYITAAELTEKEKPLSRSQKYVIKYLKRNGPSALKDIKSAADICSPRAAGDAVYALAEMGKIYRINPDEMGRGVVAVYDLQEEDEE